jgi:hypothetical protein
MAIFKYKQRSGTLYDPKLLLRFSGTIIHIKTRFLGSWLIHSNNDLTHMVQAKRTDVSVHANNAYRAADVQLYSFLSLAVDRCELSSSYVSSGGTDHVPPE